MIQLLSNRSTWSGGISNYDQDDQIDQLSTGDKHEVSNNPEENRDIVLKNPDYISRLISYAAYIKLTCQVELEESRELAEKAYSIWDKRIENMVQTETESLGASVFSGPEKRYDTSWFLPLMKDILETDPGSYPEERAEREAYQQSSYEGWTC